jgi:hypothetical protein
LEDNLRELERRMVRRPPTTALLAPPHHLDEPANLRVSFSNSEELNSMIILRNVLLAANGCLLIMGIWAIPGGDVAPLRVLGAMVMIYLVLDFFYLALTYPRGTISRYRALFLGDASTAPLEPTND